MRIASTVFVALVALIHLYIVVLEMALWTTPRGLAVFRMTPEKAEITAVLAKNQGLYNGFLAAGLIWSLLPHDERMTLELKTFFLGCVVVAGLYGAATVSRRILWVQAAPALIGLVFTWLART